MSYKGKITTAGTSEAIRLEKDLFKQHPEFKQSAEVKADIIGPGKMLISVLDESDVDNDLDPVVDAFLSFLEADMAKNVATISAVDTTIIERAHSVTDGVTYADEDFE